ncbi:MAG: CBS domain-containing protein [Mariprofundales bacterium]
MFAERIMTKEIISCRPNQPVREVVDLMSEKKLRVVPVVNPDGTLAGSINTLSFLNRIVPEYIVTGDLKAVPYAPDLGLLRKHFLTLCRPENKISDIMEHNPTTVQAHESLLSVTAALITFDRFEYVFVIDDNKQFLGMISSGDILRTLHDSTISGIEQV